MLRTAVFLCLLGLLASSAAHAHPARTNWFFWLSKPEKHGSRKLAGDFTRINTTYPYHSREQHKLLSFLRFDRRHPNLARHRSSHARPLRSARKQHTTGLF